MVGYGRETQIGLFLWAGPPRADFKLDQTYPQEEALLDHFPHRGCHLQSVWGSRLQIRTPMQLFL